MIERKRDGDELTILRLRTRRNEILIAPGQVVVLLLLKCILLLDGDFMIVVVQRSLDRRNLDLDLE